MARATMVGGMAVIVLALTMGSVVAGFVRPPVTVHHAPYTGSFSAQSSVGMTQCAKAAFIKPVSFSLRTGIGGLGAATGSAHACGKSFAQVGGYSQGYADPNLQVAVALTLPSGSHSVQTNWALAATISGMYTVKGVCPPVKPFFSSFSYNNGNGMTFINYSGKESICYAEADSIAYLEEAFVTDLTNGSQTFASSCISYCFSQLFYNNSYITNESGWEFYNQTTCTTGSGCSSSTSTYSLNYTHATAPSYSNSLSGTTTLYFNGTFVKTHKYAVVVYFFGSLFADAAGYPTASATASMNVQTLGNGLDLQSIAVV